MRCVTVIVCMDTGSIIALTWYDHRSLMRVVGIGMHDILYYAHLPDSVVYENMELQWLAETETFFVHKNILRVLIIAGTTSYVYTGYFIYLPCILET